MRKRLIYASILLLLTSCGMKQSGPTLELSESPNYLQISNFPLAYGTIEFNKLAGDFEMLDQKVFDLLKGKTGVCTVKVEQVDIDKYGKSTSTYVTIGTIDMGELSKFESWQYWQKDGGMEKLFYNYLVLDKKKVQPDSTATFTPLSHVSTATQETKPVPVQGEVAPTKSYTFSEDELYPVADDKIPENKSRSTVSGTISDVNFSEGVMQVADVSGETFTVQFYPINVSSATNSNLRLALKAGNKITSTCALAGASTLDLVSATITKR